MKTKKCTKCGVEKDYNSLFFFRNKSFKSGLNSRCKECESAWQKEYRSRPDVKIKIAKLQSNWQKENKDKVKESSNRFRNKNKDKINKKRRDRYINDPEYKQKRIDYDKKYSKSGKRLLVNSKPEQREKARLRSVKYHKENKEKIAKYAKKYKSLNSKLIKSLDAKKAKDLPDSEIRHRIKRITGLEYEDITTEMIETKRLLTFIKRELKTRLK